MTYSKEIESFIKEFVNDLSERNVAIFAGAGMSKAAGFVNWPDLLREIADELGLDVDREHDLISLAQYHVNENKGRAKINRKILEEFSDQAELTDNHKILARLPITTFWTTNYDKLIEDSLRASFRVVDVKHQKEQLATTKPKRDAVVYKMHGDVDHPAQAILTKEQYESYYKTHEHFITALSGDLISKTFLFVGFSFSDPNLDYVLSRLSIHFGENNRQHYCFIRKVKLGKDGEDIYKYNIRKQELMMGDLKRYKIKTLLVDEFSDITSILLEIERRYKKKTVFISGSAEEYGKWNRNNSQEFIHLLSKRIIQSGYRIVNGFGWGVGSAVINGALEGIYEKPDRLSEDQLIMRPFPQFASGEKKLPEMWDEYRNKMISMAGIAIFIFGNKRNENGEIILANGVLKEFEIAAAHGLVPIPISATEYAAKEISDVVLGNASKYYSEEWVPPYIKQLSDQTLERDKIIDTVLKIIQTLNK